MRQTFNLSDTQRIVIFRHSDGTYIQVENYHNDHSFQKEWRKDGAIYLNDFDKFADAIERARKLMVIA